MEARRLIFTAALLAAAVLGVLHLGVLSRAPIQLPDVRLQLFFAALSGRAAQEEAAGLRGAPESARRMLEGGGVCCFGHCNSSACNPPVHYCSSVATCEKPTSEGGCDSSATGGAKAVFCPASPPDGPDGFELSPGTGCSNWNEILLESRDAAPTFSSLQECADHCLNHPDCLQFNYQPEGVGSSRCPYSKANEQRGAGTCYLYRERVQPEKCVKAPNSCWDLYTWQNPFAPRHLEVNCPLIGALMNNGDLVPDPNTGLISRNQTREAILRVGVSVNVADATIASNFISDRCPTCGPAVNPLKMNVIFPGVDHNPVGGPHEHFRSTGIRDNQLTPSRYEITVKNCLTTSPLTWNLERNMCFSETWNCDGSACVTATRFQSNDVAEDRRPSTCPIGTTGRDNCPSALFGSINFFFQEFGTPTGEKALITNTEYQALWLEGKYPHDFAARSPRHCVQVGEATDGHFGCATCLSLVKTSDPNTSSRYCRCIVSKELPASTLASISQWNALCQPNKFELYWGASGSFVEVKDVNMTNGAPLPTA